VTQLHCRIQADNLGWEDRETADSFQRLSLEDAQRRAIPNLTASNLSEAWEEHDTRRRKEVLERFRYYMFVGLYIDDMTIHCCKFFSFDVTNPISSLVPFTYDFLDQSAMTGNDFAVALVDMLQRMEADGLHVAGIKSDGFRFRMTGLLWRDLASIQANYPEYSKLILVPCVCPRLQNSVKELFNSNP
jgi:hypothetical protein